MREIARNRAQITAIDYKKILQLSDVPSTPLWCHGGRRYIRYKVEALNPALWKTGTQEGSGSQWCDRLPSIPQDRGGKDSDRCAFFASYLTNLSVYGTKEVLVCRARYGRILRPLPRYKEDAYG
jgi:hypothetical protein